MEPSPKVFDMLQCISKWFCLQWKSFDLLNKVRYILWVVALLEACDVTNSCHHLGRHLRLYEDLEIRCKLRKWYVLCLTWKITHKYVHCTILRTRFTLIVERSWKTHVRSPSNRLLTCIFLKMAWPPSTYEVISGASWSYLVTIDTDHH